jgi:hypothetical protein
MPSVVLGAQTPVNVWENRFIFEVYCTEDAAAYFNSLLLMVRSREKRGLSVFRTSLAKNYHRRRFILSNFSFFTVLFLMLS